MFDAFKQALNAQRRDYVTSVMTAASRSRKPILAVAIIVVIVLAGVAIYYVTGQRATPTQTTTTATVTPTALPSGGTIVVEEPCCIDSLDPAVAFTNEGGEAVQNMYQGLLSYRPNTTSELVPLLAESYSVSPDGLKYTFQLRKNIVFSNGDPLNAYVMWYSFYRSAIMAQGPSYLITIALDTSGITADMLNSFNRPDNIPSESLMEIMSKPENAITVTGPNTIEFHLMSPFAGFLATLTQAQDFAVDPRVVSEHGGVTAGSTNSWMNLNAVATGPFAMAEYQPNSVLILQRNPLYWGGANGAQPMPRLDRIIIKSVPDALTRLQDVDRGSAQAILLDLSLGTELAGRSGLYVPNLGPLPAVHLIGLNNARFPFNNALIRQAVVHAINYTALVQLFHGFGVDLVGPEPRGMIGYPSDLQPYSYNITLAKELLTKAGYPNGQGIPPVTAHAFSDITPATNVVSLIQSDLAQIGIRVQIIAVTSAMGIQAYANPPTDPAYPDMTYNGYNWFPDPFAFANFWVGDVYYGAGNFAYYNNSRVNDLLHQADKALDQAQRATIYEEVAHIVYDDAPYIWVAQLENAYPSGIPVLNTNVKGYMLNIGFWENDFSGLYLVSG